MVSETHGPVASDPPHGRFTIVYLIHEAFRRDLARLSSAARAPGVDGARVRQLSAHWEFVQEQLDHHHRVEDQSLWPLVRPKLAGRQGDLTVLDDMEAQHITLEPKCEAVSAAFAGARGSSDAASREALASSIDALATKLAAHLDDEETRCFPVVDEALSVEEFEAFGKATAKAVGMRGSARFFPWIFDGAQPVERRAVLTMPPPPVRMLCEHVWEPRYERRAAALWEG
jgi:iron-sulfur cluster repair protein YtfE (RIC family)